MLKTMYQQFVTHSQPKLIDYGLITKDMNYNMRYYIYNSKDGKHVMITYIDTPLAFTPNDLPSLIANNIVKIRLLEFKDM